MTLLCLGEAIVDLVCERELDSPVDADCFRPRFGGALANVAVAARRAGAPAALAGGVGEDPWGRWLRDQLAREGVDLRWLSLVPGARTPLALITFDAEREPAFQVYGEGIGATLNSLEGRLEEALGASSALLFGSNTLVDEPERTVTLAARRLALERQIPILFDPNVRAHRWRDLERARELCLEICDGAFCVRANEAEAMWLTGRERSDPAAAAEEIAELGATLAVVTRGAGGALARGAVSAEVEGRSVETVSPLGAGDAFMGNLAAALALADWEPAAIGAALEQANEAAAEVCTVWRAVP